MRLRDRYDLEEEHETWPPPGRAEPAAELERRLRERANLRTMLHPLVRQLRALDDAVRRLPPGSALRAEFRHKMTVLRARARPLIAALLLLNRRIKALGIILSTPVATSRPVP